MTTYKIKNLDCADCAARIEERIKNLTSVRYASLNFASLSLVIDTDDIEEVRREVGRLEPSVVIAAQEGAPAEAEEKPRLKGELLFTAGALVLYVGIFLVEEFFSAHLPAWFVPGLFAALWLATGFSVLREAATNLRKGHLFDENFLMSLATLGAFAIGAFSEAAGVMVFYRIGEFLEGLSLDRSRRSIKQLLSLKADYAEVLEAGLGRKAKPEDVSVGEVILVRPGGRVPLDGIVVEGSSTLDTGPLTGESVPRSAAEGAEVLAGSLNLTGALKLRVLRPYGESSVARILKLVEEASARKSKTERFMTKFARYYTPAVIAAAALTAVLPPLLVSGAAFSDWFYRALVILVISCPCALVVSIPLGYFGGIGAAARKGILIKGSTFIDALSRTRAVAFDKTGTLTKGVFTVLDVASEPGIGRERLLEIAARAEAGSNHPIAFSLKAAYGEPVEVPAGFTEYPGFGVAAILDGKRTLAGSVRFLEREGVSVPRRNDADRPWSVRVHLAAEGKYVGSVEIGDEIKPEAADGIKMLKRLGIAEVAMLSGDAADKAEAVGKLLGLDEARGGLLPQDKVAVVKALKSKGGAVLFAGDGINDAPVLAEADVGVAMGGIGQDAAVEAADLVILNDDPRKIAVAVAVARKTRRIVTENIFFALGIKFLFVAGGLAGLAGIWEAVFADVGVAVLAVLNSMRALRVPKDA